MRLCVTEGEHEAVSIWGQSNLLSVISLLLDCQLLQVLLRYHSIRSGSEVYKNKCVTGAHADSASHPASQPITDSTGP